MTLNFFGWLRVQVKTAVLAGLGDAVEEIAADQEDGGSVQQLRLRLTMEPQPEPENKKGKRVS